MTPVFALGGGLLFVAWLLYRDVKERPAVSRASWIVVAWVVIYSSRPVMSWFADPSAAVSPQSYDEGDFGEALVSLAVIVAGLIVLLRRGARLRQLAEQNKWLAVVYLFWLHSILWSDYPIITAKRLFKDLGNVAMVLMVLTDQNSVQAMKAVCARCVYIGIPLSLVLVRYFPELGRAYTGYNQDQLSFVGITANKNTLGMLALVTVIFMLWDFLDALQTSRHSTDWVNIGARAAVLMTAWYLLVISDSATSLVCAVIGSMLLFLLGLAYFKRRPGRFEVWGISVMVSLWVVNAGLGLHEAFVQSLGRNMSLTTRTEMWPVLFRLQDNPLLGAGFDTFWAGERLVQSERALGALFLQAHNGYLETYLNGGAIGVGLLIVLLSVSYRRIRERLALGTLDARFRLAMLIVAIVHNFTEATFYKLSVVWFVTVFAMMDYRPRALDNESHDVLSAAATRS
jgi:exopolysaccharide production protein ExoQ